MKKKIIIIGLAVLLLLDLVGGGIYFFYHSLSSHVPSFSQPQLTYTTVTPQGTSTLPVDIGTLGSTTEMSITATVLKGSISYTGSFMAPECDQLSTRITTNGDTPPKITIGLILIKTTNTGCSAQMGTHTFTVSADTKNGAPTLAGVYLNNSPVRYTLIKK